MSSKDVNVSELVAEGSPALGRALTALRWSARLVGGLVATFFLMFLIGDSGSGALSVALSAEDLMSLAAIVTMVLALVVGWFREGLAAALLLGVYAVLVVVQGSLAPAAPFLLFPVIGLMYGACYFLSARLGETKEAGRRGLGMVAAGLACVIAVAGAVLGLMSVPGPKVEAPAAWVGEWQGEFDVVQSWWPQGVQTATLAMSSDGTVRGSIGEAQIHEAQLRETNRILRWMGHQQHVVHATMTGAITTEDGAEPESVVLRLHPEGETFELSFETRGGTRGESALGAVTAPRFSVERIAPNRFAGGAF